MAKLKKYSFKTRLKFEEVYSSFSSLAPRQQMAAALGGLLAGFGLLFFLPVSCASSRLAKLEKQIASHEKDAKKVFDKLAEYQQLQLRLKNFEEHVYAQSTLQLRTKLADLAEKSGLSVNMGPLKESVQKQDDEYDEVTVSGSLSKLSLEQAVDFLYAVEYGSNLGLKIKSLDLRVRYDNRQQIDISKFEVSTLVKSEGRTSEEGS